MSIRFTLFICCLLTSNFIFGQRTIIDINQDWQFKKSTPESVEKYQAIDLPHTYNTEDPFDDEPGYYRGIASYQKVINTAGYNKNKKHFLKFYAVNQTAKVFVNGNWAGEHKGGYTAFVLEIGRFLNYQNDTILVEVNNAHDVDFPPLKGDFTFYGGIYRKVEWISTDFTHFALDMFGSDGVFLDPLKVTKQAARIGVRSYLKNFDQDLHRLSVTLTDQEGKKMKRAMISQYDIKTRKWIMIFDVRENLRLWSPADPYLYNFTFAIIDKSTRVVLDELSIPYGIRYFAFDKDEGFSINNLPTKLIGVNRHQDRPGIGNALTREHHLADMEIIKDMGSNFLRTAHYPQDHSIIEYCDKNGIFVSMEIPLDHEITQSQLFTDNCKTMTQEMIYQYYNHPSIIIWAYMNEMGLWKDIQRDSALMTDVTILAQELEDLVRKEDPYRYTMIPNHGSFEIYKHFGMTEIPMIVGWNLYFGWYVPDIEGFGRFMDHAHEMVPDKPIIVSEYGAGADPRITSFAPERFDFSLDWTLAFHHSHLRQIMERPFIAGSAVWNQFDFGSETRQDAVPHINNKGLATHDRQPKPVYYLYKALLTDESFTHIEALPSSILLSKNEDKTIEAAVIQSQQAPKVIDELILNEKIAIGNKKNEIAVEGSDQSVFIEGYDVDRYWQSNNRLRINFGAGYYFTPDNGTGLWYPNTEVPTDFMKVTAGERYQPRDHGVGTDHAIDNTEFDPVYQTMLIEIEKIQLQLPDGNYKLNFYLTNLKKEISVEETIKVNDLQINIKDLKAFQAQEFSVSTEITNSVDIFFTTTTGKTFINGLEIIRL